RQLEGFRQRLGEHFGFARFQHFVAEFVCFGGGFLPPDVDFAGRRRGCGLGFVAGRGRGGIGAAAADRGQGRKETEKQRYAGFSAERGHGEDRNFGRGRRRGNRTIV